MRIRRNIASIPIRSAQETWSAIVDLVTGTDSTDSEQLVAAASTMESLIADEHPLKTPIVFKDSGPRVFFYCLYGEDAMEAGLEIDSLTSNPTAGDWHVTAPAEAEDVEWMNRTLHQRAPRITIHDVDEAPPDDTEQAANTAKEFEIDWGLVKQS